MSSLPCIPRVGIRPTRLPCAPASKSSASVVLDRPYHAPVSPKRHHVRFWMVLEKGSDGRPVWLGSITFDRGVGFSHDNGQVTHHIAPDIGAERDLLMRD